MGKGLIRRLRDEAPEAESAGAWLSQRTVWFFDLELLLPHQPMAEGSSRAKLMVENRLQRIVRRRDRIIWTVSGFYLLIASDQTDRALIVAERVRDYIVEHCGGCHDHPLAKRAMRMASPAELERFGLMCA